jgi:hypothetical protein
MKKTYQKPLLLKRDRLSAVAAFCPMSKSCG